MCGILAAVCKNDSRIDINKFNSALNALFHRGPDDYGVLDLDEVVLGHRRLSIQDVTHGAVQPMSNLTNDIHIIFNGEVYNFKELKKDLIKKKYEFRTTSDTEVILYAYQEYGLSCVDKFVGMFSIIIVDDRFEERKIFTFRDRLGIKPLFYYEDDMILILASEIKSILKLIDKPLKLNINAVSSYFSFRYPILNDSFFEGINVVPPATIYSCNLKEFSLEKEYWSLSEKINSSSKTNNEDELIASIDEILKSSISLRMISDVPVGAYLSGGVDSSLITAIMSNLRDDPVKTYTIGFEEERYNEFSFSNKVSKQYHTKHNEIKLDGSNYFESVETLINYKDAPLSVPNEVPLYLMSLELKKDITVVLSGEGADEIFGGYGRIFRSCDDYRKQKEFYGKDCEFTNSYNEKYDRKTFDNEISHFMYVYSYTNKELKRKILSKDLNWSECEDKFISKFDNAFSEIKVDSYLTKMMYAFETVHLQGLLNRVDVTTMAASVEARVPFVDHRLVELAFTIPEELRLKWNEKNGYSSTSKIVSDDISENHDTPKYLLKKVGEKYLDNEILYRKKMGFPVPLDDWFGGEFRIVAKNIVKDENNHAAKYIDVTEVVELIESENIVNDHALAMKIWMVVNFFIFCKSYRDHILA